MESSLPVRRYVDVRQRPTVVRLDELARSADWITSSFYITRDIEGHLHGLRHALEQASGCGMFLIGQYGAGKSHWLAYVTCQLREGRLVTNPPAVVALSLLNYRAATPLEQIVSEALSMRQSDDDRRLAWDAMQQAYPNGLLLVIDELSEFLRSKPDQRSFNEDVRFLQYMGEWAQGRRFWIIAAMQEGIEHTGELEYGLYRKIKDRFPLRFLLSPTHVKDLIRESILVKHDDYHAAVDALAVELQETLPASEINYADFRALYPLHPATLELLEEVRDRFSRARGIVDFAVTQLAGDPARNVAPFLDRPWGSLLTPDTIIEHFRDSFELQPEFLGLAQQFFPYYRKHLPELFPAAAARQLAEQLLKLLVLVHLSPEREGLQVNEAANWLLFRATRVDPRKNVEILGRVLRQLAERGRYVVEQAGRFRLELRDDEAAALEQFVQRQKEELGQQQEIVFEELAQALGEDDFNPLRLPRDQWQQRTVAWHFHDRTYSIYVGNDEPPPIDDVGLCVRLPWGKAAPAQGVCVLQPSAMSYSDELLELAALLRARAREWGRDVKKRLEGRLNERLALFRSQLRAAYRDVQITLPSGESDAPPQVGGNFTLKQWFEHYATWMLRRRYPAFERFAPGHGPLPKEAYRSLMRFANQGEFGEYDADEYVKLIREAYLVPMKLLVRQGRNYMVPGSIERHELVTLIRPLLEMQPSPSLVYENVADSIYGLVPDQIGLMLVFLHILGELDIRKGRRSYRELFETLPDPIQYDQLAQCSALSLEQLHELQILCEGLHVRPPKESTVLAQRKTVRLFKEAVAKHVEPLRKLLMNVQQQEQSDELVKALRQLLGWEQTLRQGNDDLNDIQQFLFEIGSARRFLSTLAELRVLPERIDRVLNERKRFQHLFHHPALTGSPDSNLAVRIEALRTPPGLDQLNLVEQWLNECRTVYEDYKSTYRKRHDEWWEKINSDPLWQWRPPRMAQSRHLGLEGVLEQLRTSGQRAERLRCRGLVNLDFQPLCACGFDGRTSPIEDELNGLRSSAKQIESALTHFFQQQSVRTRVREWVDQGLEPNPRMLSYLQGEEPYPEVSDLEMLDRHLAGVELVKELDMSALLEMISDRTWDKKALQQAIAEWSNRLPEGPIRIRGSAGSQSIDVVEWCVEQALRWGVALPQSIRGTALSEVADRVQAEWVDPEALARLDQLGLGQRIEERVICWMLERRIDASDLLSSHIDRSQTSPLLAASLEVLSPATPKNARDYAAVAEQLYRAHDAMVRIASQPWLARLDALARTPINGLPMLLDALRQDIDTQYVLLDGWGVPLLRCVEEELESFFPNWRRADTSFALVDAPTTTDACYERLIEAGFDQKLEKINRIDELLHRPFMPFEDLCRMAIAELSSACRAVRSRLDPNRPLTVFADHGFRIATDGRSYCHGGNSTIERLVPVVQMKPR